MLLLLLLLLMGVEGTERGEGVASQAPGSADSSGSKPSGMTTVAADFSKAAIAQLTSTPKFPSAVAVGVPRPPSGPPLPKGPPPGEPAEDWSKWSDEEWAAWEKSQQSYVKYDKIVSFIEENYDTSAGVGLGDLFQQFTQDMGRPGKKGKPTRWLQSCDELEVPSSRKEQQQQHQQR